MIVEPIFIFFQVIHQKTRISYDEITNDLCPVSLSLSFSVCGFQDEEQSIVDQICFFFLISRPNIFENKCSSIVEVIYDSIVKISKQLVTTIAWVYNWIINSWNNKSSKKNFLWKLGVST